MYIQRADKNSTLTGISPLTDTRLRNRTHQQPVASQKWPQKIGDADGHQGRADMEHGVDQRRAY